MVYFSLDPSVIPESAEMAELLRLGVFQRRARAERLKLQCGLGCHLAGRPGVSGQRDVAHPVYTQAVRRQQLWAR